MEGNELKKRRMGLGFTQVRLAEILGLQPNTISRYETGLLEIPKIIEVAITGLECQEKLSLDGHFDRE